jgi:DNA-binding Lrp family transcriptional regulator
MMVFNMEKIKNQLIQLLTENARYSYSQLATMVGADEGTVERAVKELEKDGVIVKYAAILNAEALTEKKVNALIEVKVAPQQLKGFDSCAEEIYNFKEVQSLYLMSGGFDLAVFVEGKDISDIAKFVSEKLSVIDGIISVQTHFILKRYKIEGQVTVPDVDLRKQIIQA